MTGTAAINDPGVYGVRGVPSLANRPPSRSYGFASWSDLSGNFWFFGGYNSGDNSDLWKYDISTNLWTWMKGPNITGQAGVYGIQSIPDTANYPPSREEVTAAWTDNNGDLWLFGGYAAGVLLNDLWRYNIASNTWTWMKGSSSTNAVGIYGTLGVENAANTPGSRMAECHWKDKNGNLWLFGGGDYINMIWRNDLWRYNPVTNNWTWMSGSSATNVAAVYGTKCITDSTNMPGGRFENRAVWTDANDHLWMFGGSTGGGTLPDVYNELWMYCVTSNRWTFESGDPMTNPAGNWGTKGISAPTNKPNARAGANGWKDHQGYLYLYGGSASGWPTPYNDLWKYRIDPACGTCGQSLPLAQFTCSDTAFCNETGECINFFDHSTGNPISWQWSFPGASPSSSTLQNPDSICYTTPGTYTVQLIVSNGTNYDTLTVSPLIIFGTNPPPPTVTIQGGDTLVSSHGSTYQWYFNGAPLTGATDSFYVAHQGGTYAVQITDSTGGCYSISNGVTIIGVQELNSNGDIHIYPNPASQSITINWPSAFRDNIVITVVNVLGEEVYREAHKAQNSGLQIVLDVSSFTDGVYSLQIGFGDRTLNKKFVVVH